LGGHGKETKNIIVGRKLSKVNLEGPGTHQQQKEKKNTPNKKKTKQKKSRKGMVSIIITSFSKIFSRCRGMTQEERREGIYVDTAFVYGRGPNSNKNNKKNNTKKQNRGREGALAR